MFTVLHGLGYFQRWFCGLVEKNPGSNHLNASSRDPPRTDRASYQDDVWAHHSSQYFNIGGKLQECAMIQNAMAVTKNRIKDLKYEVTYLKASHTFDEVHIYSFDSQVYEKENELERLRQKYRQLESEFCSSGLKRYMQNIRNGNGNGNGGV